MLPLNETSDRSDICSEFLPPPLPSRVSKKKNPISEEDGFDTLIGDDEPAKKRRQASSEEAISSTTSFLEPRTASTLSLHKPPQSPSHPKPQEAEDINDRTSEDYYFDSYSHHSIRKVKHNPPIFYKPASNTDRLSLQMKKC